MSSLLSRLLSVGRVAEAEKIVKEGAKFNKIVLPEDFRLAPINKTEKKEEGKKTFLHLLKNPNMRAKTLILYYNWFVSTFAFYGLALNMGQITGSGASLHLNFSLASLIEAPAYLAALLAVLYCGRRVPYASSLFIYGFSLLSLALIPKGVFTHDWPILVVALVSKMSITFTFGTIFLYTGELFPTEVRTSGIGSANFIGESQYSSVIDSKLCMTLQVGLAEWWRPGWRCWVARSAPSSPPWCSGSRR